MLFSPVKISCFRAKAHLVFHCYLYNKGKYHKEQMRNQSKYMLTPSSAKTRVTKSRLQGFSFASDWLRRWREFSRPITESSKAKPASQVSYVPSFEILGPCSAGLGSQEPHSSQSRDNICRIPEDPSHVRHGDARHDQPGSVS